MSTFKKILNYFKKFKNFLNFKTVRRAFTHY